MLHVLPLAGAMHLLEMLVQVELLRECARAMWALPWFWNMRDWAFFMFRFFFLGPLILLMFFILFNKIISLHFRSFLHWSINVRRIDTNLALHLRRVWCCLSSFGLALN